MKNVNPKIYTKEYYLNTCLGSEEFKKFRGDKLVSEVENLLKLIQLKKGMKVLDLGCGRGDTAFYLAKRGIYVAGIDYSKDAIEIAKDTLLKKGKNIQKFISFYLMDAKNLGFRDNNFDAVIAFDVFEHLYKEELELVMRQISRVLKKDGILLVHTEVNKIYLNFTHKYLSYPMDTFLLKLNKILIKKDYPGLPKDPRNEFHKIQHVNEPSYLYLKSLFRGYAFEGHITSNVPYKPYLSWKDLIYNIFVWFYPISSFWPLNLLFATDYICFMRNRK